ncbi:MAG TPA: tRNA (adenosine(37)-N6)-threonylcarbamoyltransferase complex dimerization subunit type 1 TsaB [Chloroflexota bacterium]|nr:tRNA (adenosine(37)-N6)-threonylcarbamoyltransferase complex dimerization subunit type 1 TsaB [Chloroflexota bacterium]
MTDERLSPEADPVPITLPGPSWSGVHAICIDSATETASLALVREGEVVGEQTWRAGMRHSRLLAPALRQLAEQCSFALRDTQMVCVCTGPGSFNGIRAGMATAIGLATGLGVPIYGVGALDLLAFPHADRTPHQRAVLPAGQGAYYSALFGSRGGRWRRLTPYTIAPLATLAAESPAKCVWCGPLSEPACGELSMLLGGAKRMVAPPQGLRRASYMVTLALAAGESGASGSSEALVPLYVRRPAITRPRLAAMAGA